MRLLHDPAVRAAVQSRVERLSPDATPRWGKMSVGQMVWHCNQVLRTALGDIQVKLVKLPAPAPVLKFFLFNLPWPHNMGTTPEFRALDSHAFDDERQQCLELIDRFTARGIDESGWGRAAFGDMTGREWSRLNAKHLEYHLTQFRS